MYPVNDPALTFPCPCDIPIRKNVWIDSVGTVTRFCPICGEKRTVDYQPTEDVPPSRPELATAKAKADIRRKAKGIPNTVKQPGV